jgi:eukaryotic-like serine/threonine-protein kinase
MDSLLERLTTDLSPAYTIDRELGGGMSRVFLATETGLNRRVVLKVLPPDMTRDLSAERFKREIAIAAGLQHAHIVPLLSAGDASGVPWFTMPLVDGQSLRERLGSGELPIAEAARILRDVASALAYAHARGVVHRDIKPENILVANGSAFVTDFGVSKALTEAGAGGGTFTSIGVALGTPAYMAPEQIAAERVDHRADIYAFGVVAYEILTGRNPFGGRSAQATMAAHMTETPAPVESLRSSVPPALALLVNESLAKSAADRPQKAQQLVDVLDGLSTPTGTAPLPTNRFARPAARAWRLPLIAAFLLIAGLVGWAAWRSQRGPELQARRVAVIPFANLTGDTALGVVGRIAAEELSRSILQTDSADVVASSAIEAALGNAGSGAEGDVQRVARATKAGIVVLGSYSRIRDSIRMQGSIVDARTGQVLRALDPTMASVSDPMVAIAGLRERLLGSIVSGDAARRVTLGSPPPKYSAYLEFVEGARMFVRNQAASRAYFERAIALDSTFVMAYGILATTYTNAGRFADAERVVSLLEAQRARLSVYDRLQLDFQHAHLRYVADEILPFSEQLYERSGDPTYAYEIGFWGLRANKPALALRGLRISDSMMTRLGWTGQARDVAQAHHLLGDYRAELAALERGTQLVPAGANGYRNARFRAYAGLGDTASAIALADTLLRGEGNPNTIGPATAVHNGAREFEAHGDTVTARRLHLLVLDWMRQRPTAAPSRARLNNLGFVWFDRGNNDSAAAYMQRAGPDSGDAAVTNAGYLAVIAARRGDSTRALAVADSLAGQQRKYDRGLSMWWRAMILAHLGRRDEAVQLLGQSYRAGQSKYGWHTHTALRPLRGFAPFEELARPQRQ